MTTVNSSVRTVLNKCAVFGLAGSLTACSGSTDNTLNIDPGDTARVFAATDGDFGTVIASDGTLTARQAAQVAILLDKALGTTELTNATVAIKRNDSGGVTLIVNGIEHPFEPNPAPGGESFLEDQFGPNNRPAQVFLASETLDDLLVAGNGFAEVFVYESRFVTDSETRSIRGYAVIGTEMADDVVNTLSTATYSGKARMDLFPTTGFVDSSTTRSSLRGDTSMSVNLDSTEISGIIDNMSYEAVPGGGTPLIDGNITMNTADFDVNAFGGTLTANDDLIANVGLITESDLGEYSGAFYGESGEEVGGALMYFGDDVTGAGFFIGTMD